MKTFKVVTLGCRTNQYESQAYSDQLRGLGYTQAPQDEPASLCIVNTCTVTSLADSSSRAQIRRLLRENPQAKLAVTGCMVESDPEAIQAIDERIQLIPNGRKEKLVEELFPEEESFPEFNIKTFDSHTRAFLKVQDGCNSFCTYCVIPYVRGRSRSRPISEIILEAKGLIASGFKEIVLTGINVGDFDGGGRLADLVRAVDQIPGLERLRISSIDPDEVDADLADAVLHGKTTCPSMHIVLQSGSNVILKKMNRKYTRQIFLDVIDTMVQQNRDFTVTTDVIVGFPGESEADFADTLEIVRSARFAKVHVFPYSARKRTRAALYPNQVSQEIIGERKQELLRAAERAAFSLREQFVGRTMSVLTEGEGYGYTENFLRVQVPTEQNKSNQIVQCTLIANTPQGLIAQ